MKIIFKTTDSCNLSCNYCYLTKHNNKLKLNNAISIITEVVKYFKEVNKKKITFVWHGGEPLLLGAKFYQSVFEFSQSISDKYDIKIINAIQSNLSIELNEYIPIFKKFNITIGTSLDGHNYYTNKNRFPSIKFYHKVLNNIKSLKNNDISVGLISVISEHNYNQMDKFYYFCKENDLNFKISPLFCEGDALNNNLIFAPDKYVFAFKQIYDCWVNDEKTHIRPSTILEMLANLIIREPFSCTFQNNCSNNFLGINYNGEVFPCGKFIGRKEYSKGNLLYNSAAEIFNNNNNFPKEISSTCLECKYFDICNGGCPYSRVLNGGFDTHCNSYYEIYSFLDKEISINRKFLSLKDNLFKTET